MALLLVGLTAAPGQRLQRFAATEHYAFKLLNCLRTGGKS